MSGIGVLWGRDLGIEFHKRRNEVSSPKPKNISHWRKGRIEEHSSESEHLQQNFEYSRKTLLGKDREQGLDYCGRVKVSLGGQKVTLNIIVQNLKRKYVDNF